MLSVSPIKTSPIAKYLVENNVKVFRNSGNDNFVEFKNSNNELLGTLYKGKNEIQGYSFVSIDLYKPGEETPFLSQYTIIDRIYRYFLEQHKFMPVKIEIKKNIKDYEHKVEKSELISRGLASNLYIEQLNESEQLKAERKKIGDGVPNDFPIYKINKPFKYEFKAHLYYPTKSINPKKAQ